jgi:hypothetical protein
MRRFGCIPPAGNHQSRQEHCERHPPFPADEREPLFVRCVGSEMITVALDGEAGVLQDFGN